MDIPNHSTTESNRSNKRGNDYEISNGDDNGQEVTEQSEDGNVGYSNRMKGGGIGGGAGAFIGGVVGSVVPGPGTVVGILAGSAIGATIGATTSATTSSLSGWGTSVKNMVTWKSKTDKETKKNL